MKKAQIQVGKFKLPAGLDELTSVSQNDFVYRSSAHSTSLRGGTSVRWFTGASSSAG
jgi:hypothetical protein